jgi:hypothetical protein
MFELLRRLTVMVVIGAGVVTYVYVPEAVVRLNAEDPLDWYESSYAPQSKLGATGYAESFLRSEQAMLPPAEFLACHLEGRVKEISGPEWKTIVQALEAAPPGSEATDGGRFFATDAPLVGEVLAWMQEMQETGSTELAKTSGGNFLYLRYADDAKPWFASLSVVGPTDVSWSSAPVELRNPCRRFVVYLLPLAGLIYLTPPRPRKLAPDALRFPRLSIVLTDVIGFTLTTFMFAAPMLIVIGRGGLAPLLDFGFDGFGPVTLVFWLLGTISFSLLVIAGGQAVRQVVLLPDGLRDVSWRRDVTVRFDEIALVEPIVVSFPTGLRRLIWIVGILARSPILISQVLMFGYARHPGLDVRLRKGSTLRIVALPGMERILDACRAAGIRIADPNHQLMQPATSAQSSATSPG